MTTAMSEQNTHREAAVQQQQAAAQPRNLNAELQVLAKFGGFNVLESSVDGIQNLNPERKARRNIFLTDPERASERKELEKRLEMWVDMLQGNKSISEMIELCQKKSAAVSDLLSQNQLKAVEEVKQLEKSYRTVMLFYKNTDSDKIKNISIVNASMEQLTDLDNSFFIDAIADELRANYDRLDLRTNYSLLVIPGYLGSNKVIERWAKIAHDNKVMIYTDFADLEKPEFAVLKESIISRFGVNGDSSGLPEDFEPLDLFIGFAIRVLVMQKLGLYRQNLEEIKALYGSMALKTGTIWEHRAGYASLNHGFGGFISTVILDTMRELRK